MPRPRLRRRPRPQRRGPASPSFHERCHQLSRLRPRQRYYGTPDTLVTDPCNLPDLFGENFSADLDNHRGQDNDGDNLYDEDDSDCGACPWDCGDIKDSEVNVVDFLALLAQWGQTGTSCDFGLGDPGVGINEFLELIAWWGPCP
ncbi:MAG: hypothetical protein ACYTGD_02785 [Planctomycetota bacterium]